MASFASAVAVICFTGPGVCGSFSTLSSKPTTSPRDTTKPGSPSSRSFDTTASPYSPSTHDATAASWKCARSSHAAR